ncbi:MAG: hypothetical protein PVI86_03365 [Phycisphaerae bacterium]|jgi:hypothetical protein
MTAARHNEPSGELGLDESSSVEPHGSGPAATPSPPPDDAGPDTGAKGDHTASPSPVEGTMPDSTTPGGSGRWWAAVVVGLIVATPLAWLLSLAGMLPALLGVFFFILFGVMIGAVVHRVAAPGRPYRKWPVVFGTTLLVGVTWVFSLYIESRDFPRGVGIKAGNQTRNIGDQTIEAFRADVARDVRRFFRERYPPGGTIGYVHWLLVSGELATEQVAGLSRPIVVPQRGYWFGIRAVLSIGLLAYGVASQTFLLRRAQDERTAPDTAEQPGPA